MFLSAIGFSHEYSAITFSLSIYLRNLNSWSYHNVHLVGFENWWILFDSTTSTQFKVMAQRLRPQELLIVVDKMYGCFLRGTFLLRMVEYGKRQCIRRNVECFIILMWPLMPLPFLAPQRIVYRIILIRMPYISLDLISLWMQPSETEQHNVVLQMLVSFTFLA